MPIAKETAAGADRLSRDEVGLAGAPIPAGEAIEQRLLDLWTEVLSVEGLGIEDDFFKCGGDSLAAVALCARIERDLGVVLPASILLSAGTPRLLASAVTAARAGVPPGCLVRVRPGGGPAAVLVHGLPGDIVGARDFAPFLDDGRRIHAIRARGLAGGETPLRSVTEMAACNLDALLAAEPHGPYLLAGFCGGSLVAYEMAQRLTRRRASVLGVALIDPPVWRAYVPWLHGLPPSAIAARAPGLPARNPADGGSERRRRRVRAAFEAALAAYVPKPYRGAMLVIHSTRRGAMLRNPATGWPRYVGTGLAFAPVDVKHRRMFDEGLERTASALQAFFDRVAPVDGREPGIAAE